MAIDPKIRSLYDRERDEAYEEARAKAAGPEPHADWFAQGRTSKYPWQITALAILLATIVLGAAFTPSAGRLYYGGEEGYCPKAPFADAIMQSVPENFCKAVGASNVLLAEVGQLIFFLALAVVGTDLMSRRIFWTGIGLTTVYALVGNIHVARPWEYGNDIFLWMEAIAPSIVTMFVGYALKNILLDMISNHFAASKELEDARQARLKRFQEPESLGTDWYRLFSGTLRNALRKANSRYKPELEELTGEDWKALIKREILASQWVVLPTDETDYDRQQRKEQIQKQIEWQQEDHPNEFEQAPIIAGVTQNPDGKWSAVLPDGSVVGSEYRQQWHAASALRNKMKRYKGETNGNNGHS